MSHLVIMAAGTGGHIIPGIAVAQAMVALFSVILLVLFFLMFVDVIPGVPRWVRYVVVLLGLGGLAMMMLPRLTQGVADSVQPGNDSSDD